MQTRDLLTAVTPTEAKEKMVVLMKFQAQTVVQTMIGLLFYLIMR